MLSKEKLEQLREWFLKESPIDAVLSFKDKCGRLLESPKTFIEMISDDEIINAMSADLSKILTVQQQLVEIRTFLEQSQESEGGFSPFEYLFVSKTTLSEEKIDFIKEQYVFFKKINAIASQIRQNNSQEAHGKVFLYKVLLDLLIPLLSNGLFCRYGNPKSKVVVEFAWVKGISVPCPVKHSVLIPATASHYPFASKLRTSLMDI